MIENCRRLKRSGKATRCFICVSMWLCLRISIACVFRPTSNSRCAADHNLELALEWLESQRMVMNDPSKRDWFIQYAGNDGKKNGTVYATDIVWVRGRSQNGRKVLD